MIVVDSSVWIDLFDGNDTPQVRLMDLLLGQRRILVGDLILCEVLQGARNDADAVLIEGFMRRAQLVAMVTVELALEAAANYRRLRMLGHTMRKTIDVLVGTFCIRNRHSLLHADRDYDPMAKHLGLRVEKVALN